MSESVQINITELKNKKLCYSKTDLSPREFVEKHEDSIPAILEVSNGYHAEIDLEYATKDVFLITHKKEQQRVILRDTKGHCLSFPTDHELKFSIKIDEVKSKESRKLKDIIILDALNRAEGKVFLEPVPAEGQTIWILLKSDKTVKMRIEPMEFVTAYDERYLVGNSITHDITHSKPFIIPLWMPISLQLATGIKDSTPDKFQQLMEKLKTHCKSFQNEKTPGNKEIILISQEKIHSNKSSGDFDLIIPTNSDYDLLPKKKEQPQTPQMKPDSKPSPKQRVINPTRTTGEKPKDIVDDEGDYLIPRNRLSSPTGNAVPNTYVPSSYVSVKHKKRTDVADHRSSDAYDYEKIGFNKSIATRPPSLPDKRNSCRPLPAIPDTGKSEETGPSQDTTFDEMARAKKIKPETIAKLRKEDIDSIEALKVTTEEDIEQLGLKIGQKRLLQAWRMEIQGQKN